MEVIVGIEIKQKVKPVIDICCREKEKAKFLVRIAIESHVMQFEGYHVIGS